MDIFTEEKEYLDKTIDVIEKEIEVSKDNLMKRLTEGKTLSGDDKKRGAHFNLNQEIDRLSKRIDVLDRIVLSPYFGRMDFRALRDTNYDKLYIGRAGVFDDKGNQVVVDWRAPIASMFYNDSCGITSYNAPEGTIIGDINLKRQLVIENKILTKILDTDIVTNDEILQEYLNVHADSRMKDIIASIQQEQNEIIRAPINENILVQGVAGSGKTSVALHRIAYLLYNVKDIMDGDKFLLLGPNKYFLNYISSVLPELEVEPIKQKSFFDLTTDYLEEKVVVKDSLPKSKNKKNIAKYNKYKNSLDYKEAIDCFLDDYLKGEFIKHGISFGGYEIFDTDYIQKAITSGVLSKLNCKRGRDMTLREFNEKKSQIYNFIVAPYIKVYKASEEGTPERELAFQKINEIRDSIYKDGEKTIKNYYKQIDKKTTEIYKLFLQNSDKYLTNLSDHEKEEFRELFANSGILREDLAALIYIKYLISGKKLDYRQVAIDEAQDYGMFNFYVLKKICPSASFSIYGDLAQAIYPYADLSNWESVGEDIFNNKYQLKNLNKGYRTTSEITKNANPVLESMGLSKASSVDRHGNEVEYIESNGDNSILLDKVLNWLDEGYHSIGIICKDNKEALNVYKDFVKLGIKVTYLDDKATKYDGGINIGTPTSVKGLEFDTVIVNDASEKKYNSNSEEDMHLLYVAVTRALHDLIILYSDELCNTLKVNTKEKEKKLVKSI